jgi:ankyrin repeat protein
MQREDLDVNYHTTNDEWTALHYASMSENEQMCVDLSTNHKTDVNVQAGDMHADEKTSLMLAIENYNDKCFDAIMKREDLNINAQNSDEETALMLSIEQNNEKYFHAVMARKDLNINVQNYNGETALLIAIKMNNKKFFDAIMKCEDIDVNLTAERKRNISSTSNGSAIIFAANSENEQMCVELAQNYSTDVKGKYVKDEDGATPLMLAAKRNNLECIKALLRRDVNAEDKDKFGKTALDYAKERVKSEGNTEVSQKDLEKIQKMFNFNRRKGIIWVVDSIDKNSFKRKRRPKNLKPKIYV